MPFGKRNALSVNVDVRERQVVVSLVVDVQTLTASHERTIAMILAALPQSTAREFARAVKRAKK